ncbi:nuclear transport factor 2 family protein [Mycolicibacterium psychrotolerans]|uniref:SnoaL-like domain-containing protein n=1 Tax=Mycolicibacterium psychrotolerans TaxID=216929 RepID=A0A7I7MHV3_9MYCO|nr:nuclear transport factor 2 family protein [Mycolicibacterium psychrotolerans]BBX71735.1 hypothetical protein MPSYJ_51960 [Mycolicibacterium psychrotolerans]
MATATDVAQSLYTALADHDVDALFALLTDDFEATVSAGMPQGVGGDHHGRVAMIAGVWGRIATDYDIAVEPSEFLEVPDGPARRVVVLGTYRGSARDGASAVDAAFAHVLTVRNDQITALHQITDTANWQIPT